MISDVAENLRVVMEQVLELVKDHGGKNAKKVVPSKDNAVELSLLHDLRELILTCKENGAFSEEKIKKALSNKYRACLGEGRASAFYNYRRVLSNEKFAEHLKAIIQE